MIPNMFRCGRANQHRFHIAARSVATHALSIFGDHSDVMTTRTTGWAMLFANSVQEAMDFALIAQASTLRARVPFLHIFDGFRTSHEVMKIQKLSDEQIRAMIDDKLVQAHRQRGLTPDLPGHAWHRTKPGRLLSMIESVRTLILCKPPKLCRKK